AVDDTDLTDARGGKIENQRRAEPAGADHQHTRGLQSLLALAADLLQHQLPLVAGNFLRGEHDPECRPSLPEPPVSGTKWLERRNGLHPSPRWGGRRASWRPGGA